MEYNSVRHLSILNAIYTNTQIESLLHERDNNPTMFLKSVLCVAIQRIAGDNDDYDVYRIIFNYQAIHGIQLKDEDVYVIAHCTKEGHTAIAKFGIM